MCSCTPHVLYAHLLGLGLAILVIAELARRNPQPRVLLGAGMAIAAVIFVYTFYMSAPDRYFSDFLKAYWEGGRAAWQGPDAVAALFTEGAEGFINLPIIAYLFAPFALLPGMPAALVFTLIGLVMTLAAWAFLCRAANLDTQQKAVLLVVFAAFGPLIYSIREGNTSHMALAAVALAFVWQRERRDLAAGALLGAAALLKLPLLLFGIYYALRGRWRVVAGGLGVCVGAALLSLLVFGWQTHVDWYVNSVAPYTRDPVSAWNVQSVAGALLRLELGAGSTHDWSPRHMSQLFTVGPAVLLMALAAAAALVPHRARVATAPGETALETEFLIVLMLAAIASPLSWTHYYAWMLMPAAFFIARSPHIAGGVAPRVLGWLAIALATAPSTPLIFENALIEDLAARFGNSRVLAGGLIMLGLLLWSRWRMANARPVANGQHAAA